MSQAVQEQQRQDSILVAYEIIPFNIWFWTIVQQLEHFWLVDGKHKNSLFVSLYIEMLHRIFKALFQFVSKVCKHSLFLFGSKICTSTEFFGAIFLTKSKNGLDLSVSIFFNLSLFWRCSSSHMSLWSSICFCNHLLLSVSFFDFVYFWNNLWRFLIAFFIIRGNLNLWCWSVTCFIEKYLSILVRNLDTMSIGTS